MSRGIESTACVWRRRRPEWWWGIWLPKVWLLFVLASALAWSVWRDVKAKRAAAEQ